MSTRRAGFVDSDDEAATDGHAGARRLPIGSMSIESSPVLHYLVQDPRRCASEIAPWERVLRHFLPFLKLWHAPPQEDGDEDKQTHSFEEIFLGMSLIGIATICMFCYMVLTISCWTPEIIRKDGTATFMRKNPHVGTNYPYMLLAKQAIQLANLHYLCGNLMEPMHGMSRQRTAGLDKIHPLGAVHFARGLVRKLFCQKEASLRWLSSFAADHVLLFTVGAGKIGHHISIMFLTLEVHEHAITNDLDLTGARHVPVIVMEMITSVYITICVVGFLYTTLEFNIVPRPHRNKEFCAAFCLFMTLWTTDFLSVQLARQMYTSPWMPFTVHPVHRVLAASAQIFVTHSTCMMGAVMLGHSCHFKRSPDITWSVILRRGIPMTCSISIYMAWNVYWRTVHKKLSCLGRTLTTVVYLYPLFKVAYVVTLGLLLLTLALCRPREAVHGQISKIWKLVDYDTALVLLTFSMAIFYHANEIFAAHGQQLILPWFLAMGQMVGPLGLACFTVSVWRRPPRPSSWNTWHGKIMGSTMWLALLFAATQFITFQDKEDCEISSALPGCCRYPYVHSYNLHDNRNIRCDIGLRCSSQHYNHAMHNKTWCSLPENMEKTKTPWYQLVRDQPEKLHGESLFDEQHCEVLLSRWKSFTRSRAQPLHHEVEEEEQHDSTAYKLFLSMGQAANVEMYFTIFGVLLKVLFLIHHPNSEQILDMDTHHHKVDHKGRHTIIALDPRTRRQTTTFVMNSQTTLASGRASQSSSFPGTSFQSERNSIDGTVELEGHH